MPAGKVAACDAARQTLGLSELDYEEWLDGRRPNLVKERFRALAKEHHPDTGSGDAALFREVARAHELLIEAIARR